MKSKKFKNILSIVNKVLLTLCAVTFLLAACRVTNVFIQHADNVSKEITLKVENNEFKK